MDNHFNRLFDTNANLSYCSKYKSVIFIKIMFWIQVIIQKHIPIFTNTLTNLGYIAGNRTMGKVDVAVVLIKPCGIT